MFQSPYSKYKMPLKLWVIFLMVMLSTGCAAFSKSKNTDKKDQAVLENQFIDKWRARAEKSPGYSPGKAKAMQAGSETTLESVPLHSRTDSRLSTQKVTMKMNQAPVMALLRTLARAVDQNIMLNEYVSGKMDINVKESPWDQVFLGILRGQGLFYEWEGDIIRIVSLEDKEKKLKHLEADQKIITEQRALQKAEPLETRVVNVNYACAKALKDNLEKLITQEEKGESLGSITVHSHTNALVIQAIPSDINKMIALVNDLDRPTQQILIEAHIVEATKETARELGIQWGGLAKTGNTWFYPGGWSEGVLGNQLSSGGIDPTSNVAANFPATFADGVGMTLGIAVESAGENILALQLSALQEEGRLNILSSPSITTLDNQKALIESGTEVPFQTKDENNSFTIEYKKAVLSLSVTPHVIEGNTLGLNILTSKDEVDFTNNVDGNPFIITRKAETNVILFDGQTTVIGGLQQETTSNSQSGVPWLKDIPLLGWLFKGIAKNLKKEEVLIFLTPHILKEMNASNQVIINNPLEKKREGSTVIHRRQ